MATQTGPSTPASDESKQEKRPPVRMTLGEFVEKVEKGELQGPFRASLHVPEPSQEAPKK